MLCRVPNTRGNLWLEACHLRLRPIVMTSVAFIAGSVPLLLGHGAGSEVRLATGITVFAGMLGITIFGLFLTPVFYVALRKWVAKHGKIETLQSMPDAPQLADVPS